MMKRIRLVRAGAMVLALGAAVNAHGVIISAGGGLGETVSFSGVGKVGDSAGLYGTGALISPMHVLTAAHLVYGVAQGDGRFEVGGVLYNSSSIAIHPGFDGGDQFDLAVITLSSIASGVDHYAINSGQILETSTPGTKVGYGMSGDGPAGYVGLEYPYGVKRAGVNSIDLITTALTDITDGLGNQATFEAGLLLWDFDNHLITGTGPLGGAALGPDEANAALGDSGAPMFQYYAAEDSWLVSGITVSGTDDFGRFGDVTADVRVSAHVDWIGAQVPEPGAVGVVGFVSVVMIRRRRR